MITEQHCEKCMGQPNQTCTESYEVLRTQAHQSGLWFTPQRRLVIAMVANVAAFGMRGSSQTGTEVMNSSKRVSEGKCHTHVQTRTPPPVMHLTVTWPGRKGCDQSRPDSMLEDANLVVGAGGGAEGWHCPQLYNSRGRREGGAKNTHGWSCTDVQNTNVGSNSWQWPTQNNNKV